ncbi:MAG: lipoprotein [Bradyrhizobium sp.]|uniref:LPS translocon maturation chaperone LptM n=1 Tax=Bradyrhizobium sp. TaxID=376 RepID=UPI001C2872E3|nr:lipoprotein [Bradyrhizobium sp.]MBU6462395.1 lipoprotein [Pseudomonadota bacterium]MDE2068925.1 lipoprotein [Bradyrhizobium sp.]MDE2242707.1 lipoprotein [Bradyrhizobium sp.]MDE2472414.1 lipoprotein [Bradyrhizobium sp.]
MNRAASHFSPGWALVLLAASALGLTGCGRKGPLDLPPTGSPQYQSSGTTAPPATDTETQQAATPSVFNPSYGADAAPTASRGTKKSFILDPILDSN